MSDARFTLVGMGEALFDIFADRQVLGGAPLNVAVHAHRLAGPLAGCAVVVSRVGQDDLGRRLISELAERGMETRYIQTDPDRETGRAYVHMNDGKPTFELEQDAAWDWLQFDPDLDDLARRCEGVAFGSLALRNGQTRNTIYRFLDTCSQRTIRLFDVNLRTNTFDRNGLQRGCEFATTVKLNDEELPVVCAILGVGSPGDEPQKLSRAMIKQFALVHLVLTRAERGTLLITPFDCIEGQPAHYPPQADADPVGAGDACAAACLLGLVQRWPIQRIADLANHAGAYVASQSGASACLPQSIVDMVKACGNGA